MSEPDLKRLFTPGTGAVPPYLAGRKEEQEYFLDCVEALIKGRIISRDLILYGPRGNGKTALLHYLQEETLRKEESRLDIVWVTPTEMGTLTKLTDRLAQDRQTLRSRIRSASVSGGFGFFGARTEVDLSRAESTLRRLLRERTRNKPLILIIDEAHTLDPEVATALLNASQTVRTGDRCPFLLVLAGTPNLKTALGKAHASFWDRSEIMPMGRLSPEEAGQALTVPLHEAGITLVPGVVGELVRRAHCYPFFLQVWGDCLARRLDQTKETEITPAQVRAVEATVIKKCDEMYDIRFNELDRMGLLPVAERVADEFLQSDEPVLHRHELKKAVKTGMAGDEPVTNERVMDKLEQLSHLGYVWPVRGYSYEPGIPSLMAYVKGYSLSRTGTVKVEPGAVPLPFEQTNRRRVNPKAQDSDIEM
ncbi:MAG: ATP-binding protein [Gammaproteobacteria bacterium]|nr:ATP-binding protein [Gammaproteobacteria bacterium]